MSGCEGEESCEEIRTGIAATFPHLSDSYNVWSDTIAPIFLASDKGDLQ